MGSGCWGEAGVEVDVKILMIVIVVFSWCIPGMSVIRLRS